MSIGREKCKILKEIRRRIAEVNGIEYVTSECRYKGDCAGTCPKCEAEVRYLEAELRARRLLGKAVMLAGVSAGVVGLAGCCEKKVAVQDEAVTETSVQEVDTVKKKRCMLFVDSRPKWDPDSNVYYDDYVDYYEEEVDTNRVYTVPDVKPEFPGGNKAVLDFVKDNIVYSPEMVKQDVWGRVVVRFEIDREGHVCNPEIIRSKGAILDSEALRVVMMLPDFKPAEVKGVPVRCLYVLPVTFTPRKEG